MSDPRLQSTEYLRVLREHCAAGKSVTPACVLALLDHCDAMQEQLDIARRNSEQVQRLVHDLMEEQLQE